MSQPVSSSTFSPFCIRRLSDGSICSPPKQEQHGGNVIIVSRIGRQERGLRFGKVLPIIPTSGGFRVPAPSLLVGAPVSGPWIVPTSPTSIGRERARPLSRLRGLLWPEGM